MVYALIAIGLTLIYGVMQIMNWAHGEMVMLGAMLVHLFFGVQGFDFGIALIMAAVVIGIIAAGMESIIFKPMRGQVLPSFIMSMGLVWILQGIATAVFGVKTKTLPTVISGSVNVFGAMITFERLMLIPIAAMMITGSYVFIQKSRWGRALRAASADSIGASLQGININKMALLAMSIGSALAAFAGGLLSSMILVNPYIGGPLVFKAFIIVYLGGERSILGTTLASLIIGYTEAIVSVFWDAGWIPTIEMAILASILLFAPGGLLGRESKE